MNYQFNGFVLEIENGEILVRNTNSELAQIFFIKPSTGFAPYSFGKFVGSTWVKVKPINWIDINDNWKVNIEIIQKDQLILLQYDVNTEELIDLSNPMIKVTNYEIQPVKFSVIIAAYKAKNYLSDCVLSILPQQNKYFNIEILIGVDNCYETLNYIYKNEFFHNLRVYFFEENVGKFTVANTLVTKSTGEYLLFFDSDDIAIDGIFDSCRYLVDNDLLVMNCLSFQDGEDHKLSTFKTNIGGCLMMKAHKFLDMNGYQRWRCSGDDEFIRRSTNQGLILYSPEPAYYFYRISQQSLSRNKMFHTNSDFRAIYRNILTIKQTNQDWQNPSKLHIDRCFKIF